MVYLKSLVMNFLLIFFANHVIPGTMIVYPTKLPHIGGDVMFAASLAVLNMLVYPVLRLLQKEVGEVKVAIACLILNFVAYAVIKLIPSSGIKIMTIQGYVILAFVVTVIGFLSNYFEMKQSQPKNPSPFP
ncbi:MAG: hypothetical protein ACD_17C00118G0005 [uncultured bacterium]|nr:MAG: hypothetical protein ACD_17C00118G0005 [uncultured bacterium]OGN56366.1 MAG: hypothetical protein A2796_02980 [Chlamydiae bacterium RIFCSPHIGHO2_01_FULL_44_39]OGN57694.1 MAG: hypothetical protein A3C42_06760 [Chlamydiae bacterium RIFCSPHIGHO2_02_FULL_45_9]OGN60242.1 MAG: hypothetical protein A3D96_05360 [Chlamydiae bacterium RIFCSPHIGHO2_12_FULL_44_59]OGN67105.1 MAG: hypothetical protein A2978_00685 [Chlamydiae bacterium RIFCSPLOWO2_01_FULL_44_52]OGN67695.1 MAG: hypothetical protein A3